MPDPSSVGAGLDPRDPPTGGRSASRWEHGSDFQLDLSVGVGDPPWGDRPVTLWGSGRAAMRALLAYGRDHERWRRLHVPSYLCQHVVGALTREIEVVAYPHAPTTGARAVVSTAAGDVVLVVATFGLRLEPRIDGPAPVVEDHTHDPGSSWARDSRADYAVASLRKTLPLPDGGALWSPLDRRLPSERPATEDHLAAAAARLSAMTLKRHYLDGGELEKAAYRELAVEGERAMDAGAISGISPYSRARLGSLPLTAWRARRRENLVAFREALGAVAGVELLDTPFAVTLILPSAAERDHLRTVLVADRIYPAVLWPLDAPAIPGIPESDVDLSRRVLTLHADQRYTAGDMTFVASRVRAALADGVAHP